MACLPITDSASLSQTYYSGGGGGGGGSANLSVSTISVANGTTGANGLSFDCGNASSIFVGSDSATDYPALGNVLEIIEQEGNPGVVGLGANVVCGGLGVIGRAGNFSSQKPGFINGDGNGSVMISSLNVSSINGAAPGAGGFFSTLSVPLPTQTSTVIMELPPGTWSYNALAVFTGNTNYLNGFANVAASSVPNYYGSLFPALSSLTNSPGIVPCEMTLNFNDSPLSTVKLICANNSASLAGTWQGGVFKLF